MSVIITALRNRPARALPIGPATRNGKPVVHKRGKMRGKPVLRRVHVPTGGSRTITAEEAVHVEKYLEAEDLTADYTLQDVTEQRAHVAATRHEKNVKAAAAEATAKAKIAKAKAARDAKKKGAANPGS